MESKEEETLRGYENEIDEIIRLLNNESFSLNNITDLENILDVAEKDLYSQIKSYCVKADELRRVLMSALTKKVETKDTFNIRACPKVV